MTTNPELIAYVDTAGDVQPEQLTGFFADWPNGPSSHTLLRILHGSSHVVLAVENRTSHVIGLITAISDGVSAAYIPHLEVLPEWRGHGIGSELVRRMLSRLERLYMIDLMCDPELQPFYERLGMRPYSGMLIRNYARQILRTVDARSSSFQISVG